MRFKDLIGFLKLKKKSVKILSIITLSCFILLVIGYFFYNEKPSYDGEYSEGLIGQPKFINPIFCHLNDTDSAISSLIFSGLMKYNKNLEPIPDLTEKFLISQDKKKYYFQIKKNIFFHDGKKMTSDDVIFTFNLIKNLNLETPLQNKFKDITIKKVNDYSFRFQLENPSDLFLEELTIGILPKHIWENINPEDILTSPFNLKPVGTGPFKFESLGKDKKNIIKFYQLSRNEQFYSKLPYLKKITFKFYPDFENAIQSLKDKKIHGLAETPKIFKKTLLRINGLNHYNLKIPYQVSIFFNLRENSDSFLKNTYIREALAHLIPKKQILKEVLNGDGTIINQETYNVTLAQKILADNGWKKNQQGLLEKDGQNLNISMTILNQPDFKNIAEIIKKSLDKIGIKINLIIATPEKFQQIIKNRDFQCLICGVLENSNDNTYSLYHSSQINPPGLNLSGFHNREADGLLEKANLSKDKKNKEIYLTEFQKIIKENIPTISLYSTNSDYFVEKRIKGIKINRLSYPQNRFIGIEDWYNK